MELIAFLGGLLFGPLSPFVAALIVGIWFILFIRLGLLPRLLEKSAMSTDQKKRVTKDVTRVVLGVGLIGAPIVPFLCWSTQSNPWLGDLATATISEVRLDVVLLFVFSLAWLAIVVEEWLIILCYFGSYYVFRYVGVPESQRKRITWYIVVVLLFVAILTGLVGFGWWVHTATVNWDELVDAYRFGLVVLSPVTGLLTIGLTVMLLISVEKILSMEESEDRREHLSRNMTLALLSTFVFLGAIGGIWSATIYRVWGQGVGF